MDFSATKYVNTRIELFRGDRLRSEKNKSKILLQGIMGDNWRSHLTQSMPLEATNVAEWLFLDAKVSSVVRPGINLLAPWPLSWLSFSLFGHRFASVNLTVPIMGLLPAEAGQALRPASHFVSRGLRHRYKEEHIFIPPGARWAMVSGAYLIQDHGSFPASYPLGAIVSFTGDDGEAIQRANFYCLDDDNRPLLYSAGPSRDIREAPDGHQLLSSVLGVTLGANALGNCCNVNISPANVYTKVSRKLCKRHRVPYRVLLLEKLNRDLPPGWLKLTLPERMGLVKGHMKDYRESEKGLFGKYKGLWFWRQHSRSPNLEGDNLEGDS